MKKLYGLAAILIVVIVGLSYFGVQFVKSQSPNIDLKDIRSQYSWRPDLQPAEVIKAVDGDTIKVRLEDGNQVTVRLLGIDTPETVDPNRPVQCFGPDASNEAKRLLENQVVLLEKDVSDKDKYDRWLRYVYLQNENDLVMVNDYLVRTGFAQILTYPPDVKYSDRLLEAQKVAQANKAGMWSACIGK